MDLLFAKQARGALCLTTLAGAVAIAAPANALTVDIGTEGYFVQTVAQGFTGYRLSSEPDPVPENNDTDAQSELVADGAKTSWSGAESTSVYSDDIGGIAGSEAEADLHNGTLKAVSYADNMSTGINDNVSATSQALARMGDTLTFSGGMGTSVDVTMDVDGMIWSDEPEAVAGASSQVQVSAYLAVFDISAGVDSGNWACFLGNSCATGPLATDMLTLDFSNHAGSLSESISDMLTATFELASNSQMVKIFGHLSTISVRGDDNAGQTTVDFYNTATFGVSATNGVSYASASGVFPGSGAPSTPAVPLPAAGLSLIAGLGALAGLRGRRRRA